MKIISSAVTMLAVAFPVAVRRVQALSEPFGITEQQCIDQGGLVFADQTGEVYEAGFLCSNTNEPPTDLVIPDDGEEWGEEFEVCCGGTGNGLWGDTIDPTSFGSGGTWWSFNLTETECTQFDGNVVADSGDGAVYQMEYICDSDGHPPVGNVTNSAGSLIGVCCLEPFVLSSSECAEYEGSVVLDSGNGAVFETDYICESDGFPPIGQVADSEGDAIGVCCLEPWTLTREECEEDEMFGVEGEVVLDTGDGAVFAPDYVCESDNFPPIGLVAEEDDEEPIGVCCLPPFDFGDFTGAPGTFSPTSGTVTTAPTSGTAGTLGLALEWTKGVKALSQLKKSNALAHKKAHAGGRRRNKARKALRKAFRA